MAFLSHCAIAAEDAQHQKELIGQWRVLKSCTYPERLEETLPWLPGEPSREPGMARVPQPSNCSAQVAAEAQGRSICLFIWGRVSPGPPQCRMMQSA